MPRTATRPCTAADVFDLHSHRVYNTARRIVGNDADADDVTQQVMTTVTRKLDSFRGESPFSAWLHTLTLRAALNYRNREWSHTRPLTDVPEPHHVLTPAASAELNDERRAVRDAVDRLPAVYHDAIHATYFDGLSLTDAAAQLGITKPALEGRLSRGRAMLREELQ